MKVPRNLGCAAEVMTAIAGMNRPDTSMKKAVVQTSHDPKRCAADMRDNEDGNHGGDGNQAIDLDLAAGVGPASDKARGDQRRRATRKIHERDIVLRDADVVYRIHRDIGNHREAGKDDEGAEQQRAQMVGVAQYIEHRDERMSAFLLAEVVAQFRQVAYCRRR